MGIFESSLAVSERSHAFSSYTDQLANAYKRGQSKITEHLLLLAVATDTDSTTTVNGVTTERLTTSPTVRLCIYVCVCVREICYGIDRYIYTYEKSPINNAHSNANGFGASMAAARYVLSQLVS